MVSKEQLYKFEENVVEWYKEGKLRSPVHLSGSIDGFLEDRLIEIFQNIKKQDWVFTTYRSHYHALLKGVPEERLKQWILDNKSIHFMDSEYKMVSSAIVGGTLSMALGVAMSINNQRKKVGTTFGKPLEPRSEAEEELNKDMSVDADTHADGHVYVFVGDMTSRTGVFWEVLNYAENHKLPISFIIEDNKLSTDTKTEEVWNSNNERYLDKLFTDYKKIERIIPYTRKYPHYGCGFFVEFPEEKKELEQKGDSF